MVLQETSFVDFSKLASEKGHVLVEDAKNYFAGDPNLETIKRVIRRGEDVVVYSGAIDSIRKLLAHGDRVGIFSNDYVHKIARAGIGKLRKELEPPRRKDIFVAAAENKLMLIPHVLPEDQTTHLVFVDDKTENLTYIASVLDGQRPVTFIHVAKTQTDADLITIPNISYLPSIRQRLANGTPLHWFLDFNGLIVDKAATTRNILTTVEQLVS